MDNAVFIPMKAGEKGKSARLRLVIFDCDGVLVDSETAVNRVVAREVTALGWPMTTAESQRIFLGMTLGDMKILIAARVGPVSDEWTRTLSRLILDELAQGVPLVPGVEATLAATTALGLPWRVASNSSHAEMVVKFKQTGLDRLISRDRRHSAGDVIAQGGRGKPAPDLFLAAAAAEGVDPADCMVVEDSLTGTRGAVAAGMTVIGFAPHGEGAALLAEGAICLVRELAELPPLFRRAMGRQP